MAIFPDFPVICSCRRSIIRTDEDKLTEHYAYQALRTNLRGIT
jgi:hypothetical protein